MYLFRDVVKEIPLDSEFHFWRYAGSDHGCHVLYECIRCRKTISHPSCVIGYRPLKKGEKLPPLPKERCPGHAKSNKF
jgi:hypothetical protein